MTNKDKEFNQLEAMEAFAKSEDNISEMIEILPDKLNPFIPEEMEAVLRQEQTTRVKNERNRVVPYVALECFSPLTADHFAVPGPDADGDSLLEQMVFEIGPLSKILSIHIRPDLSKEDALRILTKIQASIEAGEDNWAERAAYFVSGIAADIEREEMYKATFVAAMGPFCVDCPVRTGCKHVGEDTWQTGCPKDPSGTEDIEPIEPPMCPSCGKLL